MTTGPWVYFFGGEDLSDLKRKMEGIEEPAFHYSVREIIPVAGENLSKSHGACLARVETAKPLSSEAALRAEFRGVVKHLQYTAQAHRAELQERSSK